MREGERAGLAVVGTKYSWIGLRKDVDTVRLVHDGRVLLEGVTSDIHLRARIEPVVVDITPPDKPHWPVERKEVLARVKFSYSIDGERFVAFEHPPVQIDPGRWVGATIGLFASSPAGTPAYIGTSVGYADFDYFRISAME